MFANAGLNFKSSIPMKLSRLCVGIGDGVPAAHIIHGSEYFIVAYFEYQLRQVVLMYARLRLPDSLCNEANKPFQHAV